MTTTPQDEIAASVAAFKDLGPGYDQAVAESLVERIGTEIDRRIADATGGKPARQKAERAPERKPEPGRSGSAWAHWARPSSSPRS